MCDKEGHRAQAEYAGMEPAWIWLVREEAEEGRGVGPQSKTTPLLTSEE